MDRRNFLQSSLALAGAAAFPAARAAEPAPLVRPIPASGEAMPVVGLGTWITFNVGRDRALRASSTEVVRHFFAQGGRMIDSSPMYGSAQEVVGEALQVLGHPRQLFSADKVWVAPGSRGPAQIETSRRNWGIARFDLLQVHNLLAWEAHLDTLFAMKEAGQLRYVGITTSEGRRHDDIEHIMRAHPIDFVQLTYNVLDREAEARLLPLAQERGIAVIANRPFRQGALIRAVQRHRLPAFAADIDCANWAQFLLKFIVSHPAITCVIPATTRVDHLLQNMGAARGRQPDAQMRRRMIAAVEAL